MSDMLDEHGWTFSPRPQPKGDRAMAQPYERAGYGSEELQLFTPDEVSALLQVKKSWLYDVVESGAIEVVRLGKQLRFRRSSLERYLESRAYGGDGE